MYNGELQSVPKGARGILPNCEGPQPYHTILFVNNKDILRKERNTIIKYVNYIFIIFKVLYWIRYKLVFRGWLITYTEICTIMLKNIV